MLYRRTTLLTAALAVLVALLSFAMKPKGTAREALLPAAVAAAVERLDAFDAALAGYPAFFPDSSEATRLEKYRDLLRKYKSVETLFAYLHPKEAYTSFLAPVAFTDRGDGAIPVPDNWIWSMPFGIDPDSAVRGRSAAENTYTRTFIERAITAFRKVLRETDHRKRLQSLTEPELFEALRLQLLRMSTITLGNGEFVVDASAVPALQGALAGWTGPVLHYARALPSSQQALAGRLAQGAARGRALLDTATFRTLDRMRLLTEVLLPLGEDLQRLQQHFDIPSLNGFTALRPGAAHPYSKDAFNTDYFTPGKDAYYSEAKAELGMLLFFDPLLSDNNERACASCHKPELAFTDGTARSLRFDRSDLPRNAPTVINAVFQKAQFWDLRAGSLEDQLDSVVNNPDELHSSFDNVIARLSAAPQYRALFARAFPGRPIGREEVKIAIAAYERKLVGLGSPFDRYVRGDRTALDATAIQGFNLFMGKGKCGTCHYAPLFNGALPPYFDFTDHRSLGIPLRDTMSPYEVDVDPGFSKVSGNPFTHFSFKVPTVRNVALTAPYMHNGVFRTLEQVVAFYDHAGGTKFTEEMRPGMRGLPFFLLLPIPLELTQGEQQAIVRFMHSLTDTSAARHVPKALPRLEGKWARLNDRKVGGIY